MQIPPPSREELPEEEELTGKKGKKQRRKKRVANRERLAQAQKKVEEGSLAPLPEDHYLFHFPKDPRCKWCQQNLGVEEPHQPTLDDDFSRTVEHHGEVVTLDTVHVATGDIEGNYYAQVSKDLSSE